MGDILITILAILNNCLILWVMVCHTLFLTRLNAVVRDDFKRVNTYKKLINFIKQYSRYFSAHAMRLSLVGLFLVNISQLNTGYLNIKPDIQFLFASSFYISLIWFIITSYKREHEMSETIKRLQNETK